MKGLWKHLTPFAPDQSGAVSVLYEMGGLLVICDAGGCAGNVCGFDEPRWFTQRSAVFSAGLRDMDAILGRDDRLVEKLALAAEKLDARFAAIIGTPVPAVIGTDFSALRRMAEKRTGLPVLTVDSTGMGLYDAGAEKAYLALFARFAAEPCPVERGRIGVLGCTPLDLGSTDAAALTAVLRARGWTRVDCYGMGAGLDAVCTAAANERNLVVAPSGLAAAEHLKARFGTPYEICDPLAETLLPERYDYAGRTALVVHAQVRANALRAALERRGVRVQTATWFAQKPALMRPADIRLTGEEQFAALLCGGFDLLVGDAALRSAAPGFSGDVIDVPHFALSGRLARR